jgi:hypothetical protein
MRRIKVVASPSQLGLWDELDELDEPVAFHRQDAAPTSFSGGGRSAPAAPVATRPDTGARPTGGKTP